MTSGTGSPTAYEGDISIIPDTITTSRDRNFITYTLPTSYNQPTAPVASSSSTRSDWLHESKPKVPDYVAQSWQVRWMFFWTWYLLTWRVFLERTFYWEGTKRGNWTTWAQQGIKLWVSSKLYGRVWGISKRVLLSASLPAVLPTDVITDSFRVHRLVLSVAVWIRSKCLLVGNLPQSKNFECLFSSKDSSSCNRNCIYVQIHRERKISPWKCVQFSGLKSCHASHKMFRNNIFVLDGLIS